MGNIDRDVRVILGVPDAPEVEGGGSDRYSDDKLHDVLTTLTGVKNELDDLHYSLDPRSGLLGEMGLVGEVNARTFIKARLNEIVYLANRIERMF